MTDQRPVRYLTIMDIIRLHEQVEQDAGESFPILNRHGLMSALAAPQQNMFGQELFPGLFDKAAAMAGLLVKNHPFWDGNKRLAWLALREFLERNGYALHAQPHEAESILTALASNQVESDDLRRWIEHHATGS